MKANDDEFCPACGMSYERKGERRKTTHHILPRQFFHGEGETIELCQKCHTELEKRIPHDRKLSKKWYRDALCLFLYEKRNDSFENFSKKQKVMKSEIRRTEHGVDITLLCPVCNTPLKTVSIKMASEKMCVLKTQCPKCKRICLTSFMIAVADIVVIERNGPEVS